MTGFILTLRIQGLELVLGIYFVLLQHTHTWQREITDYFFLLYTAVVVDVTYLLVCLFFVHIHPLISVNTKCFSKSECKRFSEDYFCNLIL